MPDSGQHKIDVMILRLELPRRLRNMGRDHLLRGRLIVLVFRIDIDHGMTEGARRDFVPVLIEDLQVFRGDVEDDTPHAIADRWHDARDTATPRRTPPREPDCVVREIGTIEE